MNRGDSGMGFPVSSYQGVPSGIAQPGIGIIGTIGQASTLAYTPKSTVQISITASATNTTGQVSVNGIAVISLNPVQSASASGSVTVYVGAGQTATIVTSGAASAIVSAIAQ